MIKAKYEKYDDIPAEYRELYEERGGVWLLKRIEGLDTEGSVERLERSLKGSRAEVTELKEKITKFEGIDPDSAREKLDEYDELKALADAGHGAKLDDEKINDIVEKRLKSKLAPVERERDKAAKERDELESENGDLKGTITRGTIEREIRNVAAKSKMIPTAVEDAILYGANVFEVDESGKVIARENVGIAPGLSVEDTLNDLREKRPHWWPKSVGGGATGAGNGGGANSGANPWTNAGWNLTRQGDVYRENSERAKQLAKAAGTKIGGPKPAAK